MLSFGRRILRFAAVVSAALLLVSCGKKESSEGEQRTGCVSAITRYFSSVNETGMAKEYYELTFPKEYIKRVRDLEKYDDMLMCYESRMECETAHFVTSPVFGEITVRNELTEKQLSSVAAYYKNIYSIDPPAIEAGYLVIFRYTNGLGEDELKKVCALELRNDSWKIIESDIKEIESSFSADI